MSSEENKATLRRVFNEMDKGNAAVIDELFTDDFVRYAVDGGMMGKQEYKQLMTMLAKALPDVKSNIEDMVAEADKVAVRFTWSGTHKGDLMGAPPTNKRITMKEAYFVSFKGGKIAEYRGYMDRLSLEQQMKGGAAD